MQALLFLCVAGGYLYLSWPGLQGSFILDDFPNLSGLSRVADGADILAYTLTGLAGGIGRPFSYFTFALQSGSWPASPFDFKLVNILIHLGNAVLVFFIARAISALILVDRRESFAWFCAIFWLVLPIHTTTIFYVVQRMNLLAVTFSLVGIYGFLVGMSRSLQGEVKQGLLIATVTMAVGYIFGLLSKESAVLLGVFVAVLYGVLIRHRVESSKFLWDVWIIGFALAPVIAVFVYLMLDHRYMGSYAIRDFSPLERIMTEWRVLWDYIRKIVFPTSGAINLFNDDFSISRSLIEPITTLVSLLAWIWVLFLGWLLRRSTPYLLFGVLWFLGGHLLESTIIGLELYFEHRNYLPSLGVVIALIWGLYDCRDRIESRTGYGSLSGKVLMLCAAVYVSWMLTVDANEAKSWMDDKSFAMAAVRDRPDSLRANQTAVTDLVVRGDYRGATLFLHEIDDRWPGMPSTLAWLVYLNCVDPNVVMPDEALIKTRLSTAAFDRGAQSAFYEIYQIKSKGACEKLSWDTYRTWLTLMMMNPNFPQYGERANLLRLTVFSYLAEGKFNEGIDALEKIHSLKTDIETLKLKAELYYLAGRHEELKALLHAVKNQFSQRPDVWVQYEKYFSQLEQKMIESADSNSIPEDG